MRSSNAPAGNLQEKIARSGSALAMLRSSPLGPYPFPIRSEYSNWRDEQRAWRTTSILYEQHNISSDMFFRGPDVRRLFEDFTPNNFTTFGSNKAKRLLAVNPDGYLIGEDILIALSDTEYNTVGSLYASNWVKFHAEKGGYDVEIEYDPAIPLGQNRKKKLFRLTIQGPTALETVRKASNGSLGEIKFYRIGEFNIAGHPVRALNHTMSGLPGDANAGLEVYGPIESGDAVRDAILTAGTEFGMIQGGAISYPTAAIESGWFPQPLPAIYSGEAMQPYREWASPMRLEAFGSMGGSFISDVIDDYYVSPWELGYDKSIHLDHDFLGRDGLAQRRAEKKRAQVWLRWNDDDVARVLANGLMGDAHSKYMHIPTPTYATYHYDTVLVNGRTVGFSSFAAYTTNIRGLASVAVLDLDAAQDGTEVSLIWGEPNGGSARPCVERHGQTEIRATVCLQAPLAI